MWHMRISGWDGASWNIKFLEFHRHPGGAEPTHGGPFGSQHSRPGLLGIGARKKIAGMFLGQFGIPDGYI